MKQVQRKRQDQESRMREAEIARTEASTPQNPGLESLVNLINSIQGPQTQRSQFDRSFGLQQQGQAQEADFKNRALGLQAQDQQDTLAYRDRALQSGVDANQQQGILALLSHILGMQDKMGSPLVMPQAGGLQGLLSGLNIPGAQGLFGVVGGGAGPQLPRSDSDNPNLPDEAFANARKKLGK